MYDSTPNDAFLVSSTEMKDKKRIFISNMWIQDFDDGVAISK
jgi:hypothetical protein